MRRHHASVTWPLGVLLGALAAAAPTAAPAQGGLDREDVRTVEDTGATRPEGVPLPGQNVRDRRHPDFTPRGVRSGAIIVLPYATLATEYDSNVFRTDDDERADLRARLAAGANVYSARDGRAVEIRFGVDGAAHAREGDENTVDAYADATLQYRPASDVTATVSLGAIRNHEDRGDPDASVTERPIVFYDMAAAALGEWRFADGYLEAQAEATALAFEDGVSSAGVLSPQSKRDRIETDLRLRYGHYLTRRLSPFAEITVASRAYLHDADGGGRDRDAFGGTGALGVQVAFGTLSGALWVGGAARMFADSAFGSVIDPVYGASLLWNPTALTSFELTGERRYLETVRQASSIALTDSARLRVDHELRRNLRLHAAAGLSRIAFLETDQRHLTLDGGLGAEWRPNRHFAFTADYRALNRDATLAREDYMRHLVSVGATVRY